jgi:MoxR-like ATPase
VPFIIVRMRVPDLSAKLAQQAVDVVQSLRQMDLKKSPSVSETIDWAKALVMMNADSLDKHTLETTLTVLLKHESDVQKARRALLEGGRDHPLNRRSGSNQGQMRRGGWPN